MEISASGASANKILVMGIGNYVQSDDGFGVHVIRQLVATQEFLPDNVELLDGGTSIIDQLSDLLKISHLICVDVADGGNPPGSIYQFTPADITYKHSKFHHAHKISIFDTLEMVCYMKGKAPETTIIAVQPENIEWGTELTPLLKQQLPRVIQLIRNKIEQLNHKD